MLLVIINLFQPWLDITGYGFQIDFPLSEVDSRIMQAAFEYLSSLPSNRDGLTWGEAMEKIPDELWGKYGFTKAPIRPLADRNLDYMADDYLIPSKEARLIEAGANINAYLIRYLSDDFTPENQDGLLGRITAFALIWAPRYVDQNCRDLKGFTEYALSQISPDFWDVPKEEEEIDPDDYDTRDCPFYIRG